MDFNIWRDSEGIPHIQAEDKASLYKGLGYAHGKDRGMQIIYMRILGQGRVSELLNSSDSSLEIDRFFRRMNWQKGVDQAVENLSPENTALVSAYCEGINKALKQRFPWELKLLGVPYETWMIRDIFLITRMTGYLTLSQSQGEIEKLFIEMVQAGVSEEKLNNLFPGILKGLNTELIKKVKLQDTVVNPSDLWSIGAPRLSASNSWVVSGSRTESGAAIMSNDPHLEINRLPSVWYEVVMECKERWAMGASMPGLPGVLAGRTEDLSFGVTYTFMDAEDSWIEKCRDGKFFSEEEGWKSFTLRKEVIKRKKKEEFSEIFYENDHGVLAGDPSGDETYLLNTKWSGQDAGAETLNAVLAFFEAGNVQEGMDIIGPAKISFNWSFADKDGNIGYQMSGAMPERAEGISGFIPLPGWKKENDWKGIVDYKDLPRQLNPECGYIVTANNDLNSWGKTSPINMPMGDYRAKRIEELIKEKKKLTSDDMQGFQNDLYSREARDFLEILNPLLPSSENGEILKTWDCCYDCDSFGPVVFEAFLTELYAQVFGKNNLGEEAESFLRNETGIYIDFYKNFNTVLLSERSPWFNGRSREEIYSAAWNKAEKVKAQAWGKLRKFTMNHIILGGQLPRFLGFDKGPLQMPGGRATIRQGQMYQSAGRTTTFAPSLRIIAEMDKSEISSNIAGGASDRRFSPWYSNRIQGWYDNVRTSLKIDSKYHGKRLPFGLKD